VLQILVNLVGNAVRYSPAGSHVEVSVTRTDTHAIVVVADQGKGVAVEDQTRIFDKFERVDPSEAGGNGLGLYIARRLARAMQGDLTIESASGEGARFVLTLPADPARG
jgi:signal transduction histidine kinase